MQNHQSPINRLVNKTILMVAAILGLVSWLVPQLFIKFLSIDNPSFAAFEEENSISGLLIHVFMLFTGIFLGYKELSTKLWMFGIAGVVLLPLLTFFEVLKNPDSHNLWPFEMILTYPYFAMIIIGALFGRKLYGKINKGV